MNQWMSELGFRTKQCVAAGLLAVVGLVGYQAVTVAKEDHWTAHEWGTFTSVQGSDGVNRPGLHHGDERLPNFVHCPLGGGGLSYGGCLDLWNPGENPELVVTQRLETPVIYFHSKKARQVLVDVDFPQGVFTEWYPIATSYLPEAGNLQKMAAGKISWDTSVATTELEIPKVYPSSIWAPSRNVSANSITVGGENEKFIFYRGIGQFDPAFRVTSNAKGDLTAANLSKQPIAAAFLLQVTDQRGAVTKLGALAANGKLEIPAPRELGDADPSIQDFIAQAGPALKEALVASGLNADESQAMVDTWTKSYFHTVGTRILYIVPREWTDEILPIRFTPVPDELVRTLVGRVEILAQPEERELLRQVEEARATNGYFAAYELGRFAEPKMWRLHSLAQTPELKKYIGQIIADQLAGP